MISQSGAYSRLVSPAPCSLSGRNRFHSPAARAFGFSSSTIARRLPAIAVGDLAVERRLVRIDVLVHERGQTPLQVNDLRRSVSKRMARMIV